MERTTHELLALLKAREAQGPRGMSPTAIAEHRELGAEIDALEQRHPYPDRDTSPVIGPDRDQDPDTSPGCFPGTPKA